MQNTRERPTTQLVKLTINYYIVSRFHKHQANTYTVTDSICLTQRSPSLQFESDGTLRGQATPC